MSEHITRRFILNLTKFSSCRLKFCHHFMAGGPPRNVGSLTDFPIPIPDREQLLAQQRMHAQSMGMSRLPNPFQRDRSTLFRSMPTPYGEVTSELILSGNEKLDRIMTFLAPVTHEYALSDWEEEEAMKHQEFDLDAREANGKRFPDWACGKALADAIRHQNSCDGDVLFQSMARRCNLVDLFGTLQFQYYQRNPAH
jgi:hypothetical protein